MPETIACAYCRGVVNVPDEMMGGSVTCPYCRRVFAAPMSLPPEEPPPAKKPADPFAFGNAADGDESAGESQGQRRYRQQQKPKMTLMAGLVCGVVVAAVMGLTFAKKALPEKRGGGIDMTQVVIAGIAGGILAGGVALVRVLMTKGTEDTEERGRQKYRRQ